MIKIVTQKGCAKAWLEAAEYLQGNTPRRDYNLILDIAEPMQLLSDDKAIYKTVDSFLRERGNTSLSTVLNTIFPATRYLRRGRAVIDDYNNLWPILKDHPDITWGTYARRMMSRINRDGTLEKPLVKTIEKLKKQAMGAKPKRAAYELNLIDVFADIPIYDSEEDEGSIMGRPCLSHLSFKLLDNRCLMLTAFYRSHYYVERAFGNLLGLAWLLHFVATETNLKGSRLVCISSMAQLESGSPKRGKDWGPSDVDKLLSECRKEANKFARDE
jgi:hypothetical protein